MSFPDNSHDLNLYYGRTFVKVRSPAKNIWSWILAHSWAVKDLVEGTNGKEQLFAVRLLSIARQNYYTAPIKESDIDIRYPKSQFLFTGTDTVFLRRLPVRDASKALALRNSALTNPLSALIPANFRSGILEVSTETDLLHTLVINDTLPALSTYKETEALLQSKNKEYGITALPTGDRQWCLSLSIDGQFDYLLWYRLLLVGVIKDHKITPVVPEFIQEITDNFPDLELA